MRKYIYKIFLIKRPKAKAQTSNEKAMYKIVSDMLKLKEAFKIIDKNSFLMEV